MVMAKAGPAGRDKIRSQGNGSETSIAEYNFTKLRLCTSFDVSSKDKCLDSHQQ